MFNDVTRFRSNGLHFTSCGRWTYTYINAFLFNSVLFLLIGSNRPCVCVYDFIESVFLFIFNSQYACLMKCFVLTTHRSALYTRCTSGVDYTGSKGLRKLPMITISLINICDLNDNAYMYFFLFFMNFIVIWINTTIKIEVYIYSSLGVFKLVWVMKSYYTCTVDKQNREIAIISTSLIDSTLIGREIAWIITSFPTPINHTKEIQFKM